MKYFHLGDIFIEYYPGFLECYLCIVLLDAAVFYLYSQASEKNACFVYFYGDFENNNKKKNK